ncbi:MAG: DEAD/DEAH box helicase [Planctomycetes bacterium]|nr:DEAD/DEAH box helicase [Planctomycetota bacterium]
MDRSEVCDKFLDQLTFDLYPFQEEALLSWFDSDGGLLVTAPTGMGKTLIAEAAIFEALHTGQRLYYTTPLIALTDQKYREFGDLAESWGFARDQVGLITGNRRVNPDAPVRVVVAEILLNHLLADDPSLAHTSAVVMDEFHYFNDYERGIVWELSLVLLPAEVRLMLLSATVGNAPDFVRWLAEKHKRKMRLIQTTERRVPLEFIWVEDKLTTELLPQMVSADDEENRSPALVFCFNRDECWSVAERLKGLPLIDKETRALIEQELDPSDFHRGIGPKLKQMLIRGVGVHHAGLLPKHKEIIERLFLKKLIPIVVCTETLAAGINLPARSVVISTLVKGPRDDKKLIPSSSAHQMFGRAGRPQFDKQGYVYSLAHEDDVKIHKWKKKYEQIDPRSKDPGLMRARKQLERKKPFRRKSVKYWTEGQFRKLIEAGPAKLASRAMIPYQVLIYLLTKTGTLHETREFLRQRFNTPERIEKFQMQLDYMIGNLHKLGFLTRAEDGDHVTVQDHVSRLLNFRSIDPLYGDFLAEQLMRSSFEEKLQALESVLSGPTSLLWKVRLPDDLEPGPLQQDVLQPQLLQMGLLIVDQDGDLVKPDSDDYVDYMPDDTRKHVPNLPEMLLMLFDARLESPEDIFVQPKWIAGGIFGAADDFYKFAGARDLFKNEGLLLRHLLRLVILAGEFHMHTGEDPEYTQIIDRATAICAQIDAAYTDHFLTQQQQVAELSKL